MDIVKQRQHERMTKIGQITIVIQDMISKQEKINFDNLVKSIQLNFSLSSRTAKEYIDLSLFSIGKTKEELS